MKILKNKPVMKQQVYSFCFPPVHYLIIYFNMQYYVFRIGFDGGKG